MPPSLQPESRPGQRLNFGRFELQSAERRLLVDGLPAALGARAFDMLVALATRPGRLVTKNELLDIVWPGLVVEESNLHAQMSKLRKVLGRDVVATIPGRGYRFTATLQQAAPGEPASLPAAAAPARPVGATVGRLIGRDDDIHRLSEALAAPCCISLVGPAGVGKTRLARAVENDWPGPTVWVDLAPLSAPSEVAGALARAVGLPLADRDAAGALAPALRVPGTLVVLDNAEHLVEAVAALVVPLRAAVPGLHLLATSQLPLGIAGERVLRLEPLAIAPDDDTALKAGDGAPEAALALLLARIHDADPRMPVGPAAWPALREVCRQLDGLPLSLEMAAARVPLLGVEGLRR